MGDAQTDNDECTYYKRGSHEIAADNMMEVDLSHTYELGIQLKVENEMRVKIGFVCYDGGKVQFNSSRFFCANNGKDWAIV